MTRILVTGAPGFIGRYLVPELRSAGHDVIAMTSASGDVAEKSTWAGFPQTEVVVHLAARSFVPDSWNDPGGYIRANLLGTVAALGYCRAHEARLVFLSSYLYGDPERLPISEHAPLVAQNPYALSKKLAEEACRFFADRFGVNVTVLRPFNVYGAGQSEQFLIPSIIRQLEQGEEIRVKDLAPRRDYVYVRDVVRAIAKAAEGRRGFGVFNVGSGTSHSVEALIGIIQEVWRKQLPVVSAEERRKGEIMDTIADISHAEREIGWKPHYTLRQGLADMHDATPLR